MLFPDTHPDVEFIKLGRSEAKFDARTPSLVRIVQDQEIKVPTSTNRRAKFKGTWGMLGNDKYGCCDWSGWAHSLMSMSADEGGKWMPTDQIVTSAYMKYTNNVDQGTNMLDACNLRIHNTWSNFGQKKADFFVGLDLGAHLQTSVSAGIYLVGSSRLGVALPLAYQRNPYSWTMPPVNADSSWQPGSWGGHAVDAIDFDADGVWLVTWGKLIKVSWAALQYIMQEGYAMSHPNFRNRKGDTPAGLTLAMVKKYLPAAV